MRKMTGSTTILHYPSTNLGEIPITDLRRAGIRSHSALAGAAICGITDCNPGVRYRLM